MIPSSLDLGRVSYVSAFGNFRYDSRDSFIHPSEGVVLQRETTGFYFNFGHLF